MTNNTTGAVVPNSTLIPAADAAAIGIFGLADAVALFGAIKRLTNDEAVKELARIGLQRSDECRDQAALLWQDVNEAIEHLNGAGGEQ